jgi:hypothetical protein
MNKTLKELYQEHQGKISDKWSLYLSEYERVFCDLRNREISLLEIGIQNGGSLELWANYFAQAKKIVGCDINPNCLNLKYHDPRIKVIVGDANLDATQLALLSQAHPYHLIIDDGSHSSSDIIKSFVRYFPHLADGGLFVVEDLHCSYWQEFEGGLFAPFSSISFFKRLVDILNYEQWGVSLLKSELLADFSNHYGTIFDEESLSHIHSVEFINSICVIRKSKPDANQLGYRIIAGREGLVDPDIRIFNNSISTALDQSTNIWSELELTSHQKTLNDQNSISRFETSLVNQSVIKQNQELARLKKQIAHLEKQLDIVGSELMRLTDEAKKANSKISSLLRYWSFFIELLRTPHRNHLLLVKNITHSLLSIHKVRKVILPSWSYLFSPWRSKVVQKNTSHNTDSSQERIETDHPQLARWIEKYEPTSDQLAAQRIEAGRFDYTPLLSVIIPIYQLPLTVLEETLATLLDQTYSNWEACIVWGDSENLIGWNWLQEKTKSDRRFKIKYLQKNRGISLNSNEALKLAEGEYVALLDHDDTLAPWAFYEIVKLLQSSPELDFIYSDKDSIAADGKTRLNALLKPQWSPEMLHSVNYLTHLNIMRTRLVRQIGGWNQETDGAQDWDIFFRLTEKTKQIAHLPSILYHWRILPSSTATGIEAKPYAARSQLRTQQNYFNRRGLAAAVLPTSEGLFHIKWPLQLASTDVVIYQTGSLSQLVHLLDVLRAQEQKSIRNIYVVHRTPSRLLEAFKNVWGDRFILVQHDVINWHMALTLTVKAENKQTIVLINSGVFAVSSNLIEELAGWVTQHPDIAWASAIAVNSSGTVVYEAGRVVAPDYQSAPLFHQSPLFSFGWFGGPLWYRNMSAASPYAIAMSADDILTILSTFQYSEESHFSAFCLALTQGGRRGLINPFAKVYFEKPPESHWPNEGSLYHQDPYFHPAFNQVNPLELQS